MEARDSSMEAIKIAQKVQSFNFDKDSIWKEVMGEGIKMNGNESVLSHFKKQGFCQSAAAWSRNPTPLITEQLGGGNPKTPSYTAFSGASGSGKTSTMLWTVRQLEMERVLPTMCLKFYLSCNVPEDLYSYVSDYLTEYLDKAIQARTSNTLGFGDLVTQRKATTLVLVLDEVQIVGSQNL